MNTYKISIEDKNVEKWDNELGCDTSGWMMGVDLSQTIEVDQLTRKDVKKAIQGMLYLNEDISDDDLFDGNENFFLYSRLEDENSDELGEGENGFYCTYFVFIDKIELIRVSDLN